MRADGGLLGQALGSLYVAENAANAANAAKVAAENAAAKVSCKNARRAGKRWQL